MTDPTPGPWSYEEDQGIIDIKIGPQSDTERFSYARLFLPTWDHSRPDEQDRANARLIVASPNLLDVCDLTLAFHGVDTETFVARYGAGMTTRDLCDRLRAVLTKIREPL